MPVLGIDVKNPALKHHLGTLDLNTAKKQVRQI